MTPDKLFHGLTGNGVRIAVIDSGVNAAHPHIRAVEAGVTIGDASAGIMEAAPENPSENQYPDVLGHGTAVMAAIQEKAPGARYFAVRIFQSALRARIESLLSAIEWCIAQNMDVINLSLGSANPAYADRFAPLITQAASQGTILVAARETSGVPALPGSLPGVIGVGLSWQLPRHSYEYGQTAEGLRWFASGYPRPAPGIPLDRNLKGISFAVANMTGFVARALELRSLCAGPEPRTLDGVCAVLKSEADRMRGASV